MYADFCKEVQKTGNKGWLGERIWGWGLETYLSLYSSFGGHFFLCWKNLLPSTCPTLCDPMHCSLPGSSVHGILQARILGWVAIPFSRGSSLLKDGTRFLQANSLPSEPLGKPSDREKRWEKITQIKVLFLFSFFRVLWGKVLALACFCNTCFRFIQRTYAVLTPSFKDSYQLV